MQSVWSCFRVWIAAVLRCRWGNKGKRPVLSSCAYKHSSAQKTCRNGSFYTTHVSQGRTVVYLELKRMVGSHPLPVCLHQLCVAVCCDTQSALAGMSLCAALQTILYRGTMGNVMLDVIGQFSSFTFELLEKSIFLPFYCPVSTLL